MILSAVCGNSQTPEGHMIIRWCADGEVRTIEEKTLPSLSIYLSTSLFLSPSPYLSHPIFKSQAIALLPLLFASY